MYSSASDDAKHVLLGFNEKVAHLSNTRFYRRYKDTPPNLLMFVDCLDNVQSAPHDDEPRATLTFQGYMRLSVENFDREEIDAFVLTYRILTQRNDRYSIHELDKLYSSSWVESEGRNAFQQARARIKDIFESHTTMDFGDGPVPLQTLLDVVVYGALAHNTPSKERQYKTWTENPTMAAGVWIEFMAALLAVMKILRHIQDVNFALLFNVFNILPPEPLLSQVQQTLEIKCLPPSQVDAADAELFQRTVVDAGEVNPATLPDLYRRAHLVCFAQLGGQLAGVAALKRPNPGHRAEVFRQAQSTLNSVAFPYEIGWFHVIDGFRGRRISSRMMDQLVQHAEDASVYATSRIDNHPMHAVLTTHGGFVREGSEFESERGDTRLCLFVRHPTLRG